MLKDSPFPNPGEVQIKLDVNGWRRIMEKKYTIAVAGTGDGDIIGTTKKNHVESGLLAA